MGHETRNERSHFEKESAKWSIASMRVGKMLDTQTVMVGDREADVFEYLTMLIESGHRFVVRCCVNRRTDKVGGHIHEVARSALETGTRTIFLEQRGGQPAAANQTKRTARRRAHVKTTLQATQTVILPHRVRKIESSKPLQLNVVRVSADKTTEKESGSDLEWILMASEPIATPAELEQVVMHYEKRWLVEEFHKAWKTGCRTEQRPFQTFDVVANMMAMTAGIAVRLLRLRDIAHDRCSDIPADIFLSRIEWRCLWLQTRKEPLPVKPPSSRWAAKALAKLGSWYDTKGTGRIGWSTLWHGWQRLQEQAIGYALAQSHGQASGP